MPAVLRLSVLGIALAFMGAGCASDRDDPKVHAARGTLKFKNGKPIVNAVLQFTGAKQQEMTVNGFTDDSGNFILQTVLAKKKIAGAPPGDYDVTIVLPMDEKQSGGGPPIKLAKKLTVKASDDNVFDIAIDSPRK
ncbi:MAG: carboxypeptidase regulatory-like domain-containing protein [Planctomycetes bacterium]|jgi:hypothetical protein|nr:carboxypeptidase regulatory-like domain-containing protein [Planctomycetota bacterium]